MGIELKIKFSLRCEVPEEYRRRADEVRAEVDYLLERMETMVPRLQQPNHFRGPEDYRFLKKAYLERS